MKINSNGLDSLLDEIWTKTCVTDNELKLIKLYAEHRPDRQQGIEFLHNIDIKTQSYAFNYILSRFCAKIGWDNVPAAIAPSLEGLRKKITALNALLITDAFKVISRISQAGIPVLIIKGAALKLSLLQEIPQRMSDVDIVVPEEKHKDACLFAVEAGLTEDRAHHSVDFLKDGKGCLDIHYRVFKANIQKEEPTELIRSRGERKTRAMAEFFVTSPEDTFLNIVVNAMENILTGSRKGMLSALADCVDIDERYSLSYEEILLHSGEYGVRTRFIAGVRLMERFLPGRFPELYDASSEGISKRAIRRMRKLLGFRSLHKDELAKYSRIRRGLYRFRSFCVSDICEYHLDDPAGIVIIKMPAMLKQWRGVERYRQLPGSFLRTIKKWKESDREDR